VERKGVQDNIPTVRADLERGGMPTVYIRPSLSLQLAQSSKPFVGSSSQADHLMRNVAMDDSIGGS
jgi:hypothetical protein